MQKNQHVTSSAALQRCPAVTQTSSQMSDWHLRGNEILWHTADLPSACCRPVCISLLPGDNCPGACSTPLCAAAAPFESRPTNLCSRLQSASLPAPLWWSSSGKCTTPRLDDTVVTKRRGHVSMNKWAYSLCLMKKKWDKGVPFWLLPVTQQPCHTGNVWWRSQSSARGGLGLSFHSDLPPSAEVQRTAVWKTPTPKPWRHNQPREERKNRTHTPAHPRAAEQFDGIKPCCHLVEARWKYNLAALSHLMVERDCPVHVGAFLLIVTGSLHHVLRVTEQSQVYQLVIQIILLYRHIFESRCKCAFFAVINADFFSFFLVVTLQSRMALL